MRPRRRSNREINFSNISAKKSEVKQYLTKDEIADHWALSIIYYDKILLINPPLSYRHLCRTLSHESLHLVFATRLGLKESVLAHAMIDESTLFELDSRSSKHKSLTGVALLIADKRNEEGNIIVKAYYAAPWKEGIFTKKQKGRSFRSLVAEKKENTWKKALQQLNTHPTQHP